MARSTRKARDAAAGGTSKGADGQRQKDDTTDDGDDDELDDLLGGEDDDDEDDGDDDEDDEDDDPDDDDDEDDAPKKGKAKSKYVTAKDVESALDRRINVVLREIRKGQRNDDEDRGSRGSSQRGRKGSGTQTQTGPTPSDLRDARASYREFVGDQITFLDTAERQHAATIAAGMIRERMADGADPDDVGEDVAREVATQIQSLRSLYTKKVVGRLKKQGRITGGSTTSQPAPGRKSGPSTNSQYKAGEAMARQMYASRIQTTDKTGA